MRVNKNKNKNKYLYCAIVLVALILASCSREEKPDAKEPLEPSMISLTEAQQLIENEIGLLCKSTESPRHSRLCFGQGLPMVDWSFAEGYYLPQTANDCIEVPSLFPYRLQFYEKDEKGRKWFIYSHQRLMVLRNRESNQNGVFIMTVVASRSFTRSHKGVDLGSYLRNDGVFKDFSGLIIYSRLSGTLVRVDCVQDGVILQTQRVSLPKGKEEYDSACKDLSKIFGRIGYYRIQRKVLTKTSGWEDSVNVGFFPDTVEWFDEIDPSVCEDDQNWYNESWDELWNDFWGSIWDDYWTPNQEGEPPFDPGFGGGGNNTPPPSEGGEISAQGEIVDFQTIGEKTLQFRYESTISPEEQASFHTKLQQLCEIDLFQQIIGQLDLSRFHKILVLPASSFKAGVEGRFAPIKVSKGELFQRYDGNLYLPPDGSILAYIEEFFHALQFFRSSQEITCRGDIEFEAKALLAQWLSITSEDLRDSLLILKEKQQIPLFEAIRKYTDNPSGDNEELRCNAILALARFGYLNYPMSDDARNLTEILTTYHLFFN